MFSSLGSQNTQESMMQKFWVLNAIEKITKMDEYTSQVQQAQTEDGKYTVKVAHQSFMNLITADNRGQNNEHVVFGTSVLLNKFALIFVNFAARDFPNYWQTQFQDLFSLLKQPNIDAKYTLQVISKFFHF